MSEFHFLRPYLLGLLLPFLGIIYWYFKRKRSSFIWNKICSEDLLPYVVGGKANENKIPYYITILTGLLLITALAGPAWEKKSVPLIKTGSGLVIVLDLSSTMNVGDIKPTRLQRAIYKITDILNMRKEGQTALIVFAADPYVVTPLTDDIATIKAMLPVLETNIMPAQGHEADKAIEKAGELLKQAGILNGSVLLLGAEMSERELDKAIAAASREEVSVSVLGVGTDEGAPIFDKEQKGELKLSRLSKDRFSKLARATGGIYLTIRSDDSDVHELNKPLSSNQKQEQTELTQDQWQDAGYWFVFAAIPFASLFFRRGILNHFIWIVILMFPQGLFAFDLWKNSDQRAEAHFHQEEYEQARELFQDRDWQGAAHYRLGDYEQAAACFECNQTVEGYYNCGTAKAKMGDYQGALADYEKALKIDPEHEDTLYNKKLIQDKQQEDQDKQDQKEDQDQQEEQDKQDRQDKQDQKEDQDQQEEQDNKDKQEEQAEQEEQDTQDRQDNKDNEEGQDKQEMEESESDPQKNIDNKWLQKVADDPGGLLRRKFMQQYRQAAR
jgi:Ca-activated chloride channel family protein